MRMAMRQRAWFLVLLAVAPAWSAEPTAIQDGGYRFDGKLCQATVAPRGRLAELQVGGQANSLVYRTDKGVSFQVTAEGLSLIQVGGRDLACGGWTVFNAEPWFKDSGTGRVDTKSWREKLGPDVLTFAEHQCDAILPYSGGYSETTFHAAKPEQEPGYRIWSGLDNWEIYRWLVPGAQLAARLYQIEGKIPEGFQTADEFFYRNRVTPLLPVSDIQRAGSLEGTQLRYLDGLGNWKSTPDTP